MGMRLVCYEQESYLCGWESPLDGRYELHFYRMVTHFPNMRAFQ